MGVYTQTSWVNGTTPLSQTNMNNLETQYADATNAFEQDFLAGFVLFGMICTKDGVNANQLDVTSGTAFLIQTDSTIQRVAMASSSGPLTTSVHSTTYFLDLNPLGTYSFATSHSGTTNHITIATVTTDSSGNILVITDTRNLNAAIFPNSAGTIGAGVPVNGGWGVDALGTSVGYGIATPGTLTATPVSGSNLGVGVYKYVTTFLSYSGESTQSASASCTTTSSNKTVNLTVIPTGPTGTLKRNVYRTAVGGSVFKLLTTIADNTTTTYTDTTADGSLGAQNPPVHPTLGADMFKNHSGTLLAAIYGDGAAYLDTGGIFSDGLGALYFNGSAGGPALTNAGLGYASSLNELQIVSKSTGASQQSISFFSWSGSAQISIFSLGDSTGNTYLDNNGAIYLKGSSGGATLTDAAIGFATGVSELQILSKSTGAAQGLGFWVWTGSAQVEPLSINSTLGLTQITTTGAFGQVASQAATGSFGVPVIVAQAIRTSVAVTSTQTILSYTPSVNGLYRVNLYAYAGNSAPNVTVGVTWDDPDFGTVPVSGVIPSIVFGASPVVWSSGYTPGGHAAIALVPMVIYATTGGAIVVKYTNSGASPSDKVTAIIERLA